MVLWIIGLSGVGKTTLAQQVTARLRQSCDNVVMLDGDVMRALFPQDVDHTVVGRRRNAERISALAKFLDGQGIHVVAAVLSIFPEWQQWNREHFGEYVEVYLKASVDTLARRDIKNLYGPARRGKIPNVVGVDIPFPEPARPDLVLDNEADRANLGEFADRIFDLPALRRLTAA